MNDRQLELEELLATTTGTLELMNLVESGDLDSLYVLALAYYDGDYVEQDRVKCVELLEQAVAKGHEKSIHDLGCFYYYGYGFPTEFRSPKKAEKLLLVSAQKGYSPSMIFLGRMYMHGDGVKKNLVVAKELLLKAEKAGLEEASDLLNEINGL